MGSVIARACLQSGLSLKRILENIIGRPRTHTSFLMPSSIQRLGLLTSLPPEVVLDSHTVFPYTVAFMPVNEQRRLRKKALAINIQADCLGSLTKSVSFGVPFRRICPACLKADVQRFGESYWHRSHQLPGVHTCIVHGVRLRETVEPLKRNALSGRVRFPADVGLRPIYPFAPANILEVVTAVSVSCLTGGVAAAGHLPGSYRQDAIRKGYVREGGQIASVPLSLELGQFYGPRLLRDSGCGFHLGSSNSWPALMVRQHSSQQFAPARHVLMQVFLQLAPFAGDTVTATYSRPGPKLTDHAANDVKTEGQVRRQLRKAEQAGIRLTVQQLLRAAGQWAQFRHHRERFPLTNRLRQC